MRTTRKATPRKALRGAMALVAVLSMSPILSQVSSASAVEGGSAPTGQGDRATAQATFYDQLLPRLQVPVGWTGSTSPCSPGGVSSAASAATLETINLFRSMVGTDPVTLDPALSTKAQQAALMMEANNSLSHFPDSTWPCYTASGADAAGHSNLALGYSGAGSILGYMDDDGAGNTAVGHRRWVVNPPTLTMGLGMTGRANALWVLGTGAAGRSAPEWMSWPSAGYFPAALEPHGRWSLSAADPTTDLDAATVTVTGPGGPLATTRYSPQAGYGPDTLVWEVAGLPTVTTMTSDTVYDVTVSGIQRAGSPIPSVNYSVTLVKGRSPQLLTPPTLSATPTVGEPVSIVRGTSSPTTTPASYRWLNNDTPIPGATTSSYTPSASDVGDSLSAEVVERRADYADATATVAAATVLAAPFDQVSAPSLTSAPRVGSLVQATGNYWDPDPAFTWQWLRDGVAIPDATGPSYVPVSQDYQHDLAVSVTGTAPGRRTTTLTSEPRSVGAGLIRRVTAPALSGSSRVGSVLRVSRGTWSPAPTTYSYAWYRGSYRISSASTSSYRVVRADRGKYLRAEVTVKRSQYTTASYRTSARKAY